MKIQSPWMGRIKGSAGNMTGSKVNDKNVLRAKAFEVSNPNTAAQQTERSFFAQVADCCASVSEAQLRSLFSVKPKGMSRRNALTKQILYLLSNNKTNIEEYEGENFSIGNGEKVSTQVFYFNGTEENYDVTFELSQFGNNASGSTNIILVILNLTKNKLSIINSVTAIEDGIDQINYYPEVTTGDKVICYPTCTTNGSYVYEQSFGTFTIKTRATN